MKLEEGWNNLFWQIIEKKEKRCTTGWLGIVYDQESIALCAMHTPSNFLLLSHGPVEAVDCIAHIALSQKWNLAGVSGPKYLVDRYLKLVKYSHCNDSSHSCRNFELFQTTKLKKSPKFKNYKLGPVRTIDWAKARVWAQYFAMETNLPTNISAVTHLAKQMYLAKNLFMLTDSHNHPCAMAGFGRSTERYRVINMVYVPKERRAVGIGRELITRMTIYARELGFADCLLFSEWAGTRNLYDSMGFRALGKFVEYDLV